MLAQRSPGGSLKHPSHMQSPSVFSEPRTGKSMQCGWSRNFPTMPFSLVLMLDTNQLRSHPSQQHQQNTGSPLMRTLSFRGEFLAQGKRLWSQPGDTRSTSDRSLLGMYLHDRGSAGMSHTLVHTTLRPHLPEPGDGLTTYRHSPPPWEACCFLQGHFQSLQMPAGV